MFDLVTGRSEHLPQHATATVLGASALQFLAVAMAVIIPLLWVTDQLPEARAVMVFVAAPPPPPPPPPPVVPEVARPAQPAPEAAPAAPAPVTPPPELAEAVPLDTLPAFDQVVASGVAGGVPGGLAGTVAGGGIPAPPPVTPPAAKAPVRVGGNIDAPELLYSVQPTYPPLAVQSNLEGVVILEAIVNRDGTVSEVKVLRSVDRLLDAEAERAVRQWRYSPLILNGSPERFVLTVTLAFHLDAGKGSTS